MRTALPTPYPIWRAYFPVQSDIEAMYADITPDDRTMYNDAFPSTAPGFLARQITVRDHHLVIFHNQRRAGIVWLHDCWYRPDGTVDGGWIGQYVFRKYRGHGHEVWHTARDFWEFCDIHRFLVAHRTTNKHCRALVKRIGFTYAGRYDSVSEFGGQIEGLDCWTWRDHPEDIEQVRQCMRAREALLKTE